MCVKLDTELQTKNRLSEGHLL